MNHPTPSPEEKPIEVRTGQAPPKLTRKAFDKRFGERFHDPAFRAEQASIDRLCQVAWEAYEEGRKAPLTRPAGPGFADPSYELSVDWWETRQRLDAAQHRWGEASTRTRLLLINGSARNDGSCPGEMSKSWRLCQFARETGEAQGMDVSLLDLSLLTSDYGRHIHPCKGCVSTAMPLCHWPCSCYPNHAMGQVGDWMAEIYEHWVSAHAVVIVTPVYWYQSPSPLKLMIDRLVCADGGNPDPSSTHGKKAEEAKRLELAGWPYPKHLAGRVYGLLVHGDVAGIEASRRNLSDWLDWMGLIGAGARSRLDRFIGYYKPYATSHFELDQDHDVQQEMKQVVLAVAHAARELRAGSLTQPDAAIEPIRPK